MNCPKYECDGKLRIHQGIEMDRYFNINKDGTIAKKAELIEESAIYIDYNVLECTVCSLQYNYKRDGNGKVVLGEENNLEV